MSTWFLWYLLQLITGRPILSAVLVLAFYFFFDRATFRVLPDPFGFLRKRQREWKMRRLLELNAHDRKARSELAQLLYDRKAYAEAVETMKPNLEHGDDDVNTIFVMGAACAGAGYREQGEKLLAHVEEMAPNFRVGEVHLVLGRARLAGGDFAGARDQLTQLLKVRRGSIEGRVLLSQALEGLKDDGAAALLRDEAWKEYQHSPRFQQRQERQWAWRAKPSRPVLYAAIVLCLIIFVTRVVGPALKDIVATNPNGTYVDPSLQDPDE